jgi:hypothetical protein
VSRNKKTGKSKHYAFVEFMVPEVPREREFFIDNLLIRIHFIIGMNSVDRPCAMRV